MDKFYVFVSHACLSQCSSCRGMGRRARRADTDILSSQIRQALDRGVFARPDRQNDVVALRADEDQIAAAEIGRNHRSSCKMSELDSAASEPLNRQSTPAMDNLNVKTIFLVKPLIAGKPDRTIRCGQCAVNNLDRDFLAGGRLSLGLVGRHLRQKKKVNGNMEPYACHG